MSYHPKPASCAGCPAFTAGKSFVPAEGPTDAKLILIGQGPGQDEALDGRPVVGPSGKKLDSWLVRAGIRRSECGVGNVVWCWLPGNREPTPAEVEHCRKAHWGPWLEKFPQARVLVPVGIAAMRGLLGKEAAKASNAGRIFQLDQGWAVPLLHPAYILRGQFAEEPAQVEYLKRAKEIASGKDYEEEDFNRVPEGVWYRPSPTLGTLDEFRQRVGAAPVLAVDIETAGDHLRLVGLYCDATRSYLGFPVRTPGGGVYWNPQDLPVAVGWLWDLLSDPDVGKVFHNGQAFDVPMLERNGFVVRGYAFDTMLGMHIAATGVPKDLEYLSKLYLGKSGWKGMVKGEVEGEGK